MQNKIIIFDKTQSLSQSVASDAVTFSGLALAMFFSHYMDSIFWTAISFLLFLGALMGKSSSARSRKLHTKQEAIDWANSLPDDGSTGVKS